MSQAPIIAEREICIPLHRRGTERLIGGNFAGGMEINWSANGSIVRYEEDIITRRDVKINRTPAKTRSGDGATARDSESER